MSAKERKLGQLAQAIEEHSSEGVEILSSEPSLLARATIYLMGALLVAGIVWSFFGRADIIVSAPGTLGPEAEVRRVFSPIKGELVAIYVAEGTPVSEDDVLARINAQGVIQAAAQAMDSQLKLEEAERNYRLYPAQKKLATLKLEALEAKIEAEEAVHEKRISDGLSTIAEEQRLKLEKARADLEKARRLRDKAKKDAERYERLYERPGGGGVSRNKVEEMKGAYLAKAADYLDAATKLGELEIKLNKEYAQKRYEVATSFQQLTEARLQYEGEIVKAQNQENRVLMALRTARLNAEASSRLRFEHVDEDNFLRILSPYSGVVTHVGYTQTGDKVRDDQPFVAIAPEGARRVLNLEIQERDRGFLREGMPVKVKFNAFPYQRYGFIEGVLEYVGPSTVIQPQTKKPIYKGRASIEREFFMVDGSKRPLRYGMGATAEIIVQKRRLIDLALDPFRRLKR